MSVSIWQLRLLTGGYSAIRRSGILSTSLGRSVFTRSYFLYKRYLEDPFYRLVRKRPELFQGGDVLDIGANIGYTASAFSQGAAAGNHVYAFEPEPFNFKLLKRVACHRRLAGRIIPVHSAVGAIDGYIDLWLNDSHHADHRIMTNEYRSHAAGASVIRVPITTIDTFWRGRTAKICFIKIDVQGYEPAVCEGMDQTIADNPSAVIAVEYMPSALRELGFKPEEFLAWFRKRDYVLHSLRKDGSIVAGQSAELGRVGYCDLLFARAPLV